ncbi:uncharacterized protein LOC114207559 isoform X5 [Eumetopias jubatus]|uniref:Uncharacterized protein LOC112827149 isoform X5 n=1 Tax=Callorhinus ursinus TaxID=34884 RepID=A0A3Q7PD91_CALUR|nr:uncharacterized protein LOC112827149 isoform X5 [Callorhinus ursinus]XP_027957327.1 uncharacterized protein LOC114207559 isoform X5 [Eumetopias jubatus]
MRESRGSLGNERMRSAQIQVVTIAEEMGRTQSRIPHYIVVMSPLASVDCGSFAEFLCFDDLDGIEEYRSGIFLM